MRLNRSSWLLQPLRDERPEVIVGRLLELLDRHGAIRPRQLRAQPAQARAIFQWHRDHRQEHVERQDLGKVRHELAGAARAQGAVSSRAFTVTCGSIAITWREARPFITAPRPSRVLGAILLERDEPRR
jgi:hypothetical protein